MTKAIQKALVLKGASAPAGAPAILAADAVDKLVAKLTTVVDYVRPKNIAVTGTDPTSNPLPATFKTRMGCIATLLDANAAKKTADAHFNGLPSIDLSAMTAGGFALDQACSASFTLLLPLYLTTIRTVNQLLGVSGSDFAAYIDNTRHIVMDDKYGSGEAPFQFTTQVPQAASFLLMLSHDAPSKTSRVAVSSTAIAESHVHTVGDAPDANSLIRMFSFNAAQVNTVPNAQSAGWLMTSKAYAADGSNEDNALAAVITGWKGLLGIA